MTQARAILRYEPAQSPVATLIADRFVLMLAIVVGAVAIIHFLQLPAD